MNRVHLRNHFPPTSPLLLSSSSPILGLLCDDLFTTGKDSRQDGCSTNLRSSTGYAPKKIELDKNLVKPKNSTIDDQDYMEEISVDRLAAAPPYDSATGYELKETQSDDFEPRRVELD